MPDLGQPVSPIVRRTPGERRAYLDGFDAGIRAVEREHKRGFLGVDAVARAKASADLVRSTMPDDEPPPWGQSDG